MKKRILVACEFSGRVRNSFNRFDNCEAISADLLPTETPGPHYQGNVLDIIDNGFDLMVCHPPCRFLASSGSRWWKSRQKEQEEALEFVRTLLNADIPQIALENPVGCISTRIRKPDQYIQPYEYGCGHTKKTGLWLKNLPLLKPTNIVEGREPAIWKIGPSGKKDEPRWKKRSVTYQGIADAMGEQWSQI